MVRRKQLKKRERERKKKSKRGREKIKRAREEGEEKSGFEPTNWF